MKFKIGDKVVPINKTIGWKLEKSKEWKKAQDIGQNYLYIIRIDEDGTHSCSVSAHSYGGDHFAESDLKLFYGEKSENERITELEKKVAMIPEIEKKVASLEERLAKLEQVEIDKMQWLRGEIDGVIEHEGKKYRKVDRVAREDDVVIFTKSLWSFISTNKPYKIYKSADEIAFTDDEGSILYLYTGGFGEGIIVYEPIAQDVQRQTVECAEAKTPNQLRAEIIEKAKAVVDEFTNKHHNINFISQSRRITQLIVYGKGGVIKKYFTAKCHPNDVFNEWIGKAILVRKFYGQDASEFENAVQPTEVVKGMIIKNKRDVIREIYAVKPTKRTYKTKEDFEFTNANKGYTFIDENDFEYWTWLDQIERIIDDTNAEY